MNGKKTDLKRYDGEGWGDGGFKVHYYVLKQKGLKKHMVKRLLAILVAWRNDTKLVNI